LSVLYLSEEWRRVWHTQLEALGFQRNAGHFQVIEGMDVHPFHLLSRARRGSEEIVVVDTVTWLMGLNLNNRDEVVKELKQWTAMCSDGKTLLLLAHLNKRGEVAGSHAFGAGVDTVITYRDVEGWRDLRMVDLRSRMLAETPEPFAIRKTGAVFTIEEIPNELLLSQAQAQVRAVLPTDPDEALTWEEIAARTGFKEGKTRTILHHLVELGLARDTTGHLGAGGRGNAARYVGVPDQEEAE
jgi:predicted ATP-dependent serine protease